MQDAHRQGPHRFAGPITTEKPRFPSPLIQREGCVGGMVARPQRTMPPGVDTCAADVVS